jgi:ribosomal protein S18 acetylase RimI-like enzyme
MADEVSFRPIGPEDIPALAASFKRAFSDYFVQLDMDEAHLRQFIEVNDIDLGLSILVETSGGRAIGQTLSGRRGDLGWVGGAGLDPEFRGKGIAREMMRRQLKAFDNAGVQEVLLEVLSQNERAQKLYDGLGFQQVRELHYYRHMHPDPDEVPEPEGLRFEEAPVGQVLEFYTPDHPWQSMRESVSKLKDAKAFMSFKVEGGYSEELGLGMPDIPKLPDEMPGPQGSELEGYCIYRELEKGIAVVDLYSAGNARELIGYILRTTGGKPVIASHVFDKGAITAYEGLGFERHLMQFEMNRFRPAL